MKRAVVLLTVLSGLAAAQPKAAPAVRLDIASPAAQARLRSAAASDPILSAMLEELARARKLSTLGESIYYMEIGVDDAESIDISASLGALFEPTRTRLRPVRIAARVGMPGFDNTGSLFSDVFSGTRWDSGALPLDNQPLALRQAFWLALDRAYKSATEAIGMKRAALRGVTVSDTLPDFWSQAPQLLIDDVKPVKFDDKAWQDRVRSLSALFRLYPELSNSGVQFDYSQGTTYHADTTGTLVRLPDRLAIMTVRASRQAADGMLVYDGLQIAALDPAQMGSDGELRQAAEGVAKNVTALAAAPAGEAYVGPVLFSGTAAAQVFAEVFGANLGATRRPVSEPGRTVPVLLSEFDGRIGARVLPDFMSVSDDATLTEYQKRPLVGTYRADLEGQFPAPLKLVESGILKTLLTTRQPIRGTDGPNGHARLPGSFGVKTARISNLLIDSAKKESDEQLKARLIEMIRQQGKPYGMLVRKTDFPSAGSLEELRRSSLRSARGGAGTRPVAAPILLYRVYLDGREELVRGLRFRALGTRAFRDILAAGDRQYQFDFIENGMPLALMGTGAYVVGCSVVAPSVLFEELELEPASDELPKPPVIGPPPITP